MATRRGSMPGAPALGQAAARTVASIAVAAVAAVAVIGAVAGLATSARASTAALLRFDLSGVEDPDHELADTLREALAGQFALVPADRILSVLRQKPLLRKCQDAACLKQFAALVEARYVVRAGVSGTPDGNGFSLELYADDVAEGRSLVPDKRACSPCRWADVKERLASMAVTLGDRAVLAPAATATSATEEAPASSATRPDPAKRRGMCPGGGCTALKWITGGAALALIATGAVMLAENNQCAVTISPPVQPNARCPVVYDTAIEGGALLGVGAIALATSVVLFVLDRPRTKLLPALTAGPHGATLSLVAAF